MRAAPLVGAARKMGARPRFQGRLPPGPGLLQGQVGDDEAVHAQAPGFLGGAFQAVLQDGVVIAHQNQRNFGFLAQFPRQFQDFLEMHPLFQGPVTGRLDGGAIGQGVGEGNAQLQQVRAPGGHLQGQGFGGLKIRVPGGDKGNEGFFAPLFEFPKYRVNALHSSPPKYRQWVGGGRAVE